MTKKEINTKASEFKIITDQKDEPDLETAQKFVGPKLRELLFLMVIT